MRVRNRTLAFACLLAAATGCGQPATPDGNAAAVAGNQVPGTMSASAPALSGETGFARAAACYARLSAVSRLFSVIAEDSTGADRDDLMGRASSRLAASGRYRSIASELGAGLGRSASDIEAALRAADDEVERQRTGMPFDEFMIWVGREADGCPPSPAA